MLKQVVRFERDTTIKDDICYQEGFKLVTQGVSCNNCRVHLVTDRFLSRDFQAQVMKDTRPFPNGTYPYVMILDTAGCNMRCRACYSWIYWAPESRAKPTKVDAVTLAKQFICKIDKLNDDVLISKKPRVSQKTKRPFSRLRVSGGEPLFETNGNSTSFWLEFFKSLDLEIGRLIKNHHLTLKSEQEWIAMGLKERNQSFPVFLKSDNGKLRIRFDSNGMLFSTPEFAENFIGGIYESNLKWIKIDLTFSIKGTTSFEYDWFIKLNSSFQPENIQAIEPLKNHPQWKALENIRNSISKYEQISTLSQPSTNLLSNTYFNPCGDVSLTVERGIMHNHDERLYIYAKNALDWGSFAVKLAAEGFQLSTTENCIYLGQYPKALAWRYMDKGKYEMRFKCPHHPDKAFLSYSTQGKSVLPSMKHRSINCYNDPNLDHLAAKIKVHNQCVGNECKHSKRTCDYWIELIPSS